MISACRAVNIGISLSHCSAALDFTYFHCCVTAVALILRPTRNGLEPSGGFGKQRCLMLTFLCRVILYCSGALGLLWLLYQLFIKGDVPEALFFQSQLAVEGNRRGMWILRSTESSVLIIPSLGHLSVCLVGYKMLSGENWR